MKSIEISLPTFGGFYDSVWMNADSCYEEMRQFQEDHQLDGFEWKHLDDWWPKEEYYTDVIKKYCENYQDAINMELNLDVTMEYRSLWKPKYYNFSTDKIYAYIKWEDDYNLVNKLLLLMGKHKEKLSDLIYRHHTSCDGFISFMDNEFEAWVEHIKAISYNYIENEDNIYLSHLIAYLLMCEMNFKYLSEFDIDYMAIDILDDISLYSYLEPRGEDAINEYEQYLKLTQK